VHCPRSAHCGKLKLRLCQRWIGHQLGATSKAVYARGPQVLAQLDIVYTFANDLALQFDEFATACSDWAWTSSRRIATSNVSSRMLSQPPSSSASLPPSSPAGFATAAVESGVAAALRYQSRCAHHFSTGAAIAAAATVAGVGFAGGGAAQQLEFAPKCSAHGPRAVGHTGRGDCFSTNRCARHCNSRGLQRCRTVESDEHSADLISQWRLATPDSTAAVGESAG